MSVGSRLRADPSTGSRRLACTTQPRSACEDSDARARCPEWGGGDEEARRAELESRILILVTLALVAFGIVMVYSATSAAAAVGGANPNYFLERQVIYAALGIVLLVIAQHWDYRRLRALAPALVLVSLVPARRRARDRRRP